MARLRQAWKLLLPLLILGVAAGVVVLLLATRPVPPDEPAEERAWPVAVHPVEHAAHSPELRLTGFLESSATVTLTAAVEADVAEVAHREGDTVSAGDTLVRLDEEELELALAEREAEVAELAAQRRIDEARVATDRDELELEEQLLTLLEREAARLRDLAGDQLAAASDLERAEQERTRQQLAVAERRFAVETAEARLDQLAARADRARTLRDRARLNLARAHQRAPFDGRVASVSVAVGDRVRPGEPLLTLYDTARLEVRAQVPRHHLSRLRAADPEQLDAVAQIDGETVPLELSRLGGRAEPGQGGVEALFQVTERRPALVLGRFASLTVTLASEPDTVLLPFEALYDTDRVYRVRDGRMERVAVERLGEKRLPGGERGVLVRGAELADGDRIVATQIPQALEGLRVQVVEE